MDKLEELGYNAFLFSFLDNEDNVQFTSTSTVRCCATSKMLQYLHAVIVAGEHAQILYV